MIESIVLLFEYLRLKAWRRILILQGMPERDLEELWEWTIPDYKEDQDGH